MRPLAILLAMIATIAPVHAAPLRVVSFGTSLSAADHWQPAVAAALGDCTKVEIVTIAKAGANSGWAVGNLAALRDARPEVVLIEFSVNDASLLHGVPVGDSRANTIAILDAVVAAQARPVLMTMNPAHGLHGLSRPFLGDYYRLYRDLAAERQVTLVDIEPSWLSRGGLAAAIPDGVHPTAEAAIAVTAPAVTAVLRPLLCPTPSGRPGAPGR